MGSEPQNKWEGLSWLKGNEAPAARAATSPSVPFQAPPPTFAYRITARMFFMATTISSLVSLGCVYMAQTNDRGLIIEGIIRLSPYGATIFYWCGAAVAFSIVPILLAQLPLLFMNREIVLGDSAITVPRPWFPNRPYQIQLRDITSVKVSSYKQYIFIKIRHAGGSHTINSNYLPNQDDARTIIDWLARHVPGRT